MKHKNSPLILLFGGVATLVLAPACGTKFNDCKAKMTCDGDIGEGGAAGDGGELDSGGSGGTGGDSASIGAGGSSGTGGSNGSGAGAGGSGGAGGTEGTGGNPGSGGASTTGTGGEGGTGGATTGGTGGDGGTGGTGGAVEPCNETASPFEDECVVSDEYGIFVSPEGHDVDGDGTRENPYATLGAGMIQAKAQSKRLYACATAGAFDDALSIGTVLDSVELFGSLDCGDWSVDEQLRTAVAPAEGSALVLEDLVDGVTIEGFSFTSVDASAPGASSVAAFIQDSDNVVLRNVALTAGDGAGGENGATVPESLPSQSTLNGENGTVSNGGVMEPVDCPAGGTTKGGDGGDPVCSSPGGDGSPDYSGSGGEGGPMGGTSCTNGFGQQGANAPSVSSGSGASTLGALNGGGWTPADGDPGEPGLPGQGGGGGAGTCTSGGGSGGSGGAGGCGGAGGAFGRGGGASIALLVLNSTVTVTDSELTTGAAGAGGAGDAGQQGQAGGGSGSGLYLGCNGGAGGRGSDGGAGGGGAGGISVGVLAQGQEPTVMTSTISPGALGDGGLGGDPGDNDGLDGISQDQLTL